MLGENRYIINGPQVLKGDVVISGSKNAALPIIAATVLSKKEIELDNVPRLVDVKNLVEILKNMGSYVEFQGNKLVVCHDGIGNETDQYLSGKLRASVLLLGPTLARKGEAIVYLPGGCSIGTRPIDLHLKGLEKLGAHIKVEKGYVYAKAKKLVGADIVLDFPSVGATENIMMAAALAEGVTTITGAAKEPEIEDLANFINSIGGDVRGAGTNEIKIHGVKELNVPSQYRIMPDRIEAGTFMVAAAINHKNRVTLKSVCVKDLEQIMDKLEEMGVRFQVEGDSVKVIPPMRLKAVDITTMPHPGFPTDLQAQMMTILAFADGKSVIKETIFENRMNHAKELQKIGVDVSIQQGVAIINGKKGLLGATHYVGASLESFDLRGGASMVLAALNSKGVSEVLNIYHIERGYENLIGKFNNLGVEIEMQ